MNKRKTSGFSLIELMVTVLVVSILVGIAIPTYRSSIRKSRRTDARSALVDLQAREERYFNINPSQGYTTLAANLGYAASGATTDMSSAWQPVGTNGYYQVEITSLAAPSATGPGYYLITAQPVPGTDQAKDSCTQFTLDQTGLQGATDSTGSGASAVTDCWK